VLHLSAGSVAGPKVQVQPARRDACWYGSRQGEVVRKAISELLGPPDPVRRCRTHKLRDVTERLPAEMRADVRKLMRAACRLVRDEGSARLKTLADWLGRDGHGDAVASRWRDAAMVLRSSATAFLECEKRFRRIMGHRDLWVLEQALNALTQQHGLASAKKIA
jgi:hypothetical protein